MSLTSHLRNKDSPVRGWIDAQIPDLTRTLKTLRADLPDDLLERTIRPPDGVPPSTIGIALDYRIRQFVGLVAASETVGYEGARWLVEQHLNEHEPENPALWRNARELAGGFMVGGWVDLADSDLAHLAPAAFFGSVDSILAELNPVGRILDEDSEKALDTICCAMALFEEVFRYGGIWDRSPLAALSMRGSIDGVLALVPASWTSDVSAVSDRLLRSVGDRLMGPAILNPTFALSSAIGGADADLVVDGCLLEIKSTLKPRLDPEWLRQLLGYVLLDADDAYAISRIGLLLSRQAVLVSWPLDALLAAMAGPQHPSVPELRAKFAQLLASLSVEDDS